jgi:hypothetical protein
MAIFVVRSSEDGILISLPSLVRRLQVGDLPEWRLRDLELHPTGTNSRPLGFLIPEFEALTRSREYRLSRSDFEEFLSVDAQILDGTVDGFKHVGDDRPYVSLTCVDSTLWEVSTEDPALIDRFNRNGLA